jgi:ubiquinone/menaquinone biosynthesis C-methylase UbiE
MLSYIFMKILEGRPRSYDRRMARLSRGRVKEAKELVVAEVPEDSQTLEIGCGTGELAAMLIRRNAAVTGFDISSAMVEVARSRVIEEKLEDKLTILHMGVEEMDELPPSSFDAVVATLVFSELSSDERRFALQESFRVLKPEGRIVVADEVVPRAPIRKILQALMRLPMVAATYLIAHDSTHPIPDLPGELESAGFIVKKELRSQGDAFALLVGVRQASRKP